MPTVTQRVVSKLTFFGCAWCFFFFFYSRVMQGNVRLLCQTYKHTHTGLSLEAICASLLGWGWGHRFYSFPPNDSSKCADVDFFWGRGFLLADFRSSEQRVIRWLSSGTFSLSQRCLGRRYGGLIGSLNQVCSCGTRDVIGTTKWLGLWFKRFYCAVSQVCHELKL